MSFVKCQTSGSYRFFEEICITKLLIYKLSSRLRSWLCLCNNDDNRAIHGAFSGQFRLVFFDRWLPPNSWFWDMLWQVPGSGPHQCQPRGNHNKGLLKTLHKQSLQPADVHVHSWKTIPVLLQCWINWITPRVCLPEIMLPCYWKNDNDYVLSSISPSLYCISRLFIWQEVKGTLHLLCIN